MKRLVLLSVVGFLLVSCQPSADGISVIPQPLDVVVQGGGFSITSKTTVVVNAREAVDVAGYLQDILADAGVVVQIDTIGLSNNSNTIAFICNPDLLPKHGSEGYSLEVADNGIVIEAASGAGCFYAVQTLRQLMPAGFEENGRVFKKLSVPCVKITDKPQFGWRGFHLDCSRHFMSKEFVKRYIDLIAYHKMNILHWHLTDDQGWRIEIDKYPKLTEIGAWRTLADGSRYGGFYTKDDIREVVAYAAERYVNIVPEIEMPGHEVAALASYPHLSCTGKQLEVESSWGVFKDVFCAGNQATFTFLQDVLDEVVELFPFKYIHIGGDEVPKYRWERCPKCNALLQREKLKDYEDMQRFFIQKIATYLEAKNRRIIGWDEIMEGGLPGGAAVQAWRGMEKVREAVEQGAYAIAMPTSHCYFDYSIDVTDLPKVYTYDPIPDGITPEQQKYVLGGECAIWTERAPQDLVDSKVFPRILAISEVLWTYPKVRDYENFKKKVRIHYGRLTELGVHYGLEQSMVLFNNKLSAGGDTMMVEIVSGCDYYKIHYTIDGSQPTTSSAVYTKPIVLLNSAVVRAAAFNGATQVDEVFVNEVVLSKSTGKPLTLNYTPALKYYAGGNGALVDGRKGTLNYYDGIWQGVQGTPDIVATVDLGSEQVVSRLSIGFLQSNPSWIFIPQKVDYYTSVDGGHFSKVAEVASLVAPRAGGNVIYNFNASITPVSCRYVRVVATSIGPCPDWHPAAGSPSWMFADEFVVQ